jgi:hypothetical protein
MVNGFAEFNVNWVINALQTAGGRSVLDWSQLFTIQGITPVEIRSNAREM